MITRFLQTWSTFIEEHEEYLADMTVKLEAELPAKIQFHTAERANSYYSHAHFDVPDPSTLNSKPIMQNILHQAYSLQPPPCIVNIPHPPKKKKTTAKGRKNEGGGNPRNGDLAYQGARKPR